MKTELARGSVPSILPSFGTSGSPKLKRWLRFFEAAVMVATERRRLARLDERALADIGLDRALAAREAERHFLDVPQHRVRRR